MTRDQVIEHLCQTVGYTHYVINDFNNRNGFCKNCMKRLKNNSKDFTYSKKTLEYVRRAVIEKLEREGCYTHVNFLRD